MLQASVCSPYAFFIAVYVCVRVFFLINNEILPPHVVPGVTGRNLKVGTFDIAEMLAEFFARFRTTRNRKCSYYL